MSRRRPAEIHVNHERWLISYADFITLLFAFFVVMYSISQVNEGKYRVLSGALAESFHTIKPEQDSSISQLDVDIDALPVETQSIELFNQLTQELKATFSALIDSGMMTVSSNDSWLQIQLSDSILFSSGSADASDQAKSIFTQVANILSDVDNAIQIEGFTDNVPINTDKYPSNWELSTARASAIVKWMNQSGIAAVRLAAVGFGEYQPIASNDTAQGRTKNRRVAIMVSRDKRPHPLDFSATVLPIEVSSQNDGALSNNLREGGASSSAPSNLAKPALQPVELEGGNLLFTSDPDLPRNN